jgi:hypothetical protein
MKANYLAELKKLLMLNDEIHQHFVGISSSLFGEQ